MGGLVGPNGSPIAKGKLLTARQLTVTLDPEKHMYLTDIARANNLTLHEAATSLLQTVIVEEHMALRRLKFVWMLNNWASWGHN